MQIAKALVTRDVGQDLFLAHVHLTPSISRMDVGIDDWLVAFAEEHTELASHDARALDALSRLLDP
jgi:hypothetical protein